MSGHWEEEKEFSGDNPRLWRFVFFLAKHMPHCLLAALAYPVGFFYWCGARQQRKVLRDYAGHLPRRVSSLSVFIAFSLTLVEKMEGWMGRMKEKEMHDPFDDDYADYQKTIREGNGVVMIVSHLGNAELMRSLSGDTALTLLGRPVKVVSIVNFGTTASFNRLLKALNPESMEGLISTDEITPGAMEEIIDTLDGGGIVVIAGDRTDWKSARKNFRIPFLGEDASFPYGVFYLAALTGHPVYAVTAARRRDLSPRRRYERCVWKLPGVQGEGRKAREEGARAMAAAYAKRLEEQTLRHPRQWGNFYDFWGDEET